MAEGGINILPIQDKLTDMIDSGAVNLLKVSYIGQSLPCVIMEIKKSVIITENIQIYKHNDDVAVQSTLITVYKSSSRVVVL